MKTVSFLRAVELKIVIRKIMSIFAFSATIFLVVEQTLMRVYKKGGFRTMKGSEK